MSPHQAHDPSPQPPVSPPLAVPTRTERKLTRGSAVSLRGRVNGLGRGMSILACNDSEQQQ